MKHILIFHLSTLYKSQGTITQVTKPVNLFMEWHDSGIFQRVNSYFGNPIDFHHTFLCVLQCLDESLLGSLAVSSRELPLSSTNPAIRRSVSNKGGHLKEVILPLLTLSTLTSKGRGGASSPQGFLVALNKICD